MIGYATILAKLMVWAAPLLTPILQSILHSHYIKKAYTALRVRIFLAIRSDTCFEGESETTSKSDSTDLSRDCIQSIGSSPEDPPRPGELDSPASTCQLISVPIRP